MKKSLIAMSIASLFAFAIVLFSACSGSGHHQEPPFYDADSAKKADTVKKAIPLPAPAHIDSVKKPTILTFAVHSMQVTSPVENMRDSVNVGEGAMAPAKTYSAKVFFVDSLQKEHTVELSGFEFLKLEDRKTMHGNFDQVKIAFEKITRAQPTDLIVSIDSADSRSPHVTVTQKVKPVNTGKKIGNASVREEEKMVVIYENEGNL